MPDPGSSVLPQEDFSWEVQKILGNSSNIRCFTLILNRNDRKCEASLICALVLGAFTLEKQTHGWKKSQWWCYGPVSPREQSNF